MSDQKRTWKDVTLAQALTEVRREIQLRKRVYPGWVNSRKMTHAAASEQQFRLIAAMKQLERLLILEEASEELNGSPTAQSELVMSDDSFLGKLKALFADGPNPAKHWEAHPGEAKAIYELIIQAAPRWSEPIPDNMH